MGRILRLVLAGLLAACALSGVVRLYAPVEGNERQLAFLRERLEHGAGEDAQRLFPEGYFFLHVLYGLASADTGHLADARWALSKLDGAEGRAPFTEGLAPRYGIFYAGWTNWLRGRILSRERDAGELRRFDDESRAIAAAFDASPTPFLPAYPGQAWPVDSTVAIASLRLHDELAGETYGATVRRWVGRARERLDPATGLLPHVVDPVTGDALQGARGSSQSVILRFLPSVDNDFAREQYRTFRDRFVVRPLGLGPAVREYPKGTDGAADVDSGPLPLGVSLSATVVAVGAARVNGDLGLADAMEHFGEFAGVPMNTLTTKRYALGLLPIGDAFLVWAHTAEAGPDQPGGGIGALWRLPLAILLLLVGAAPWLGRIRQQRRHRTDEGGVVEVVVPEGLQDQALVDGDEDAGEGRRVRGRAGQ
ncbi:hypothetical protein GCM10018962_81900 [Dactylosporangium matsuzakiense]|uniref:Uncharacterized protein n=1 Tax=Dactylosporangium matsuzakiense TaxID=53360 RepID=A0A9W6KCC5_9ACTN|nr:hypothetical protein GCM10017581_000070 [Dactylosporangium matsuzakiense]